MTHEEKQRSFYEHLCRHPHAYAAAQAFAHKLSAKDPAAKVALHALAAKPDHRSQNALRAIAVVIKYEHGGIFAGFANVATTGGKVIRLALSPAAWVLSTGGKGFRWVGSTLQHLSHAI